MDHPVLRELAEAVSRTGFEGRVFLVGGAVRDELLGKQVALDFDLVVEGDALELARELFEMGVSSIPPVTYPRFGTAMVMVNGERVELVTARKENYREDSRKPTVEPATILEDAMRRDFTCNTLMVRLGTDEVVDPLGTGLADLKAGILRTPLDPGETFREDPLRMLRAVRFRWKLGFEYAPGVWEALVESAARLKIISVERIQEELRKILVLPEAWRAVEELRTSGLLSEFWPELLASVGVDQGGGAPTVWEHILGVVRTSKPDLMVRLAALLHDVDKPTTKTIEKGRVRFWKHEEIGAETAVKMMRRLHFSEAEVGRVKVLVRQHMRFGSQGEFSKRAARRLIRDTGAAIDQLLDLAVADREAYKDGAGRRIEQLRELVNEVRKETPMEALVSPLSGAEIMELTGLEPGPEVGEVKARLEEMVVEGSLGAGDKAAARRALTKGLVAQVGNASGGADVGLEHEDQEDESCT